MPSHKRKPPWIDKRHCYTGMAPRSHVTALQAWKMWNNIMSWRQNLFIGMHSGRPDKTVNGNHDGAFHWCISSADKADTANPLRPIGIMALEWHTDIRSDTREMHWYDPHTSGAPQEIYSYDSGEGYDSTYGDDLFFTTDTRWYTSDSDGDPITYTPEDVAADGFRHAKLTYGAGMFAALTIMHIPEALTDEQLIAGHSNFEVGQTIRGYDSDAGTSLGRLIHNIGDGTNGDFLEKHTRRYLIHQAHPTGWGKTSTSGYEDVFNGGTWRVRSRNLQEYTSGNIACLPALVVTCSRAGAKIRLSTSGAADNWVYTCDGTESATMVTASDGTGASGSDVLNVDRDDYDYVKMEMDTNGSYDCLAHTVCLTDGPGWS